MIANAQRDSYLTPERGVETQIRHGTPEFNRTNLALFSAGFTTFALLYCVQPLLPVFARDFHVGAAESSLALSLTTPRVLVFELKPEENPMQHELVEAPIRAPQDAQPASETKS